MTSDGGAVAAFGFRFQYLVTVEEFLRTVTGSSDDPGSLVLIVEPRRHDIGVGNDDDVVDFAIERNGRVERHVQVKSSVVPSESNTLGYADVEKIFARMGSEGEEAAVLTNRPLAPKLVGACGNPSRSAEGSVAYLVTAAELTQGESSPRRMVMRDDRGAAAIKGSILALIRGIRRDRALGQGETSAGLLAALLMDAVFDSAADLAARRISGADINDLLCIPDAQVAHVLRRFDWGVPLLEVPRLVSPVARTAELMELTALFTESVASRNPRAVVLTGVTGFGKSTIAADFCHLNRHFYEHVCWIDCRTQGLVEAKAKSILVDLGVDEEAIGDVPTAFRSEMARLGGPFVLVFDGAITRQQIEPYIPSSGCGFVIVTSTNSIGWWSAATQLQIDAFTEEEAVACFEAFAQFESDTHTPAIIEIVERLGRVPLATAMAASYFRNADEDVSQLSRQYFARLDSLSEATAVPEGYDKTAFAAIRFAVAQLGLDSSPERRSETRALIYHAAFMAPELIPVNLLLQTVSETTTVNLLDPPKPQIADQARRNGVLTNLRTQSIAKRRHYADSSTVVNPASDTISIHPLVHEILREIHRRSAPDEYVVDLLALLMTCTMGWIAALRSKGQFFALEQLMVHARWILELVSAVQLTSVIDPSRVYVFRCARLFLRYEIATTHASRGHYDNSVNEIELALDEVSDLTLSHGAQFLAATAACAALADNVLGNLGQQRCAMWADRALAELIKFDAVGGPNRGDQLVRLAIQAAQSIEQSNIESKQDLIDKFGEIACRQSISAVPDAVQIESLQELVVRGEFAAVLELVQRMRGSEPSADEQVMYDHFDAIAYLHLGRFSDAEQAIDRILQLAGRWSYLHTSLRLASKAIDRALRQTRPEWHARSARLQTQHVAVQQLLDRLSAEAAS
ncbi:ATP-binding protein [Nocardia sp. NPDC057663]|uniref:ATP-binding protein n=1 Tax=Nocardia sp. NPDC057663 TaxID=3346201 RepID=UPI003672C854